MSVSRDKVIIDLLKQLPCDSFTSRGDVIAKALRKGESPGYASFLADEHERLFRPPMLDN